MKKLLCVVILSLCIAASQAHEFWIQSQRYFFAVGEKATLSFVVGEGFVGEPWKSTAARLVRLEHHQVSGISDLRAFAKEGERNQVELELKSEGTHLVVMQSNNSFIELDAEKFNNYLKEDGLDEAYQQREKTNSLNKPGRELYSRYSKLLLQVGNKRDDTALKSAGLPLEIVPEKNPYDYKPGELVKFKILFQGKPLFGAKVMVWNRKNNQTMAQPVYTMQDGTIEARISNTGSWMISTVKMIPSKSGEADWESYWGSFVFGVQ
ncbi:MAG: DUF4198 domain-containing protein [Cyclobacteriaceae bacterium]|nr:DUF4198 domain-containing protein [Cyclobacteriaceae bacterium]